ncbi:MAG: NUDIX domain-containing protein [Patescibacteria group bacterium]
MAETENQLFFVGQKAFIDKAGKLLVLHGKDSDSEAGESNYIDLPGGRIQEDDGVNFFESLRREVREECGLEIEIGKPFCIYFRKLGARSRTPGMLVYNVGFQCAYKSGEVRLSYEHSGYEWVTKDDYSKLDDGSATFQALKEYFDLLK